MHPKDFVRGNLGDLGLALIAAYDSPQRGRWASSHGGRGHTAPVRFPGALGFVTPGPGTATRPAERTLPTQACPGTPDRAGELCLGRLHPVMIIFLLFGVIIVTAAGTAIATALQPLPPSSPLSARGDKWAQIGVLVTAFGVAFGGNLLLLGIPGAVWLELAEPLARPWCSAQSLSEFGAAAGWPAAIVITALWPASFVPAYWFVRRSASSVQLVLRALAAVGFVGAVGLGFALLILRVNCRPV